MELSLTKLPWWGQLLAFVLVCGGAVFGFWNFYVSDVQSEIALRQTRVHRRGLLSGGLAVLHPQRVLFREVAFINQLPNSLFP